MAPLYAPSTRAARIAVLERELAALRADQDTEFLTVIALVVGRRTFAAGELWTHAQVAMELRVLFAEHGITSPRQLGRRLQSLRGRTRGALRLARVGRDHHAGGLWMITLDDPMGQTI
jgi:hypothetical protein